MIDTFLAHQLQETPSIIKEIIERIDNSSILSLTDRKGKILSVNNNFCEISGYNYDELIGKPHSIVNSRYHDRSFWKDMWKTVGNKRVWRNEVCNRKKDGDVYWVDSFVYPITNEEGKVKNYLSIRNDITDKKKEEVRSLNLANKLQAVYNSTNELVFLLDLNFKILSLNKAAKVKLYEWSGKKASIGKAIADYLPSELQGIFRRTFNECWTCKRAESIERKLKVGIDKWYSIVFRPAIDHEGEVFAISVTFDDIHEVKLYEQELETKNQQLEQLAWKQSHEIRAPITRLLGLLNLLEISNSENSINELFPRIKEVTHEINDLISKNVNDINFIYESEFK